MPPRVQLYTYSDLADQTGVEVGTLRVWRKRGKLPAPDFTVGQSPAWKPETMADWIRDHKHTTDTTEAEA